MYIRCMNLGLTLKGRAAFVGIMIPHSTDHEVYANKVDLFCKNRDSYSGSSTKMDFKMSVIVVLVNFSLKRC